MEVRVRETRKNQVDIRCICNRLILKLEKSKLVLLCPRCKRSVYIDFTGLADNDEILNRVIIN